MVTEIQFLNLLLVRHVGDTVAKRQIRVKRLAPSLNYLHKHQRLEVHSIQSEKSPNIEQRTRVSIYFLRLDGLFQVCSIKSLMDSRTSRNLIILRLSVALHVSTHIRYSPYS